MTEHRSVTGTNLQPTECLILMDSLGIEVRHVFKGDIIARKGYRIDDIRRYIVRNQIDKYKSIIVIIGTNDLIRSK